MSIEKRALEKYPIFISEYSDSCEEYDSNESDRLTYIEGATDQKSIDIEKALDWINKNLSRVDGWSVIESSFRKAMEE